LHDSSELSDFIWDCDQPVPYFSEIPLKESEIDRDIVKSKIVRNEDSDSYDYTKNFILNMAKYAINQKYILHENSSATAEELALEYINLMTSFIEHMLITEDADAFYNFANEQGYITMGKYLDRLNTRANAGYCLLSVLYEIESELSKTDQPKQHVVTFDDYVNVPLAAEELVKQINNPAKYERLKVPFPSGLLLYGPPGTGKTYLAKAIAGQAKCPFFEYSGSDFLLELYVGSGKKAVKEAFAKAREAAENNNPQVAIIFIDEIDAIGSRTRNNRNHTAETITQLLVEMDGFADTKAKVIVIAGTNMPESLDSALVRSGRFATKIKIEYPNEAARKQLLSKILSQRPIKENINLKKLEDLLAMATEGSSQADITAFVNNAASKAIAENKNALDYDCFVRAMTDQKIASAKELLPKRDEQKEIVKQLLQDSDITCDTQTLNSLVLDVQDMSQEQIEEIFSAAAKRTPDLSLDWIHVAIDAKEKQKIIQSNKEIVALCNQVYGSAEIAIDFDEKALRSVSDTDDQEEKNKLIRKFWYSITPEAIFREFNTKFDSLNEVPEGPPQKIVVENE
jgi:AAA+ superfamily predicted ATPase